MTDEDSPRAACVRLAVESYVRAMECGSFRRAVPRVLARLTSDASTAAKGLSQKDAARKLPLEALLPWASRFVSLVAEHDDRGGDASVLEVLEPLVARLVERRPEVARGPLRYAVERLEDRGVLPEDTTATHRLAARCRDDAAEAFVVALQGLGDPFLRLQDGLSEMYKLLQDDDVGGGDAQWLARRRALGRVWARLRDELLAEEWPFVGALVGGKNLRFGVGWRKKFRSGSLASAFSGSVPDDEEAKPGVHQESRWGETWRRGGNLVPRTRGEVATAKAKLGEVIAKVREELKKFLRRNHPPETTLEAFSPYLSSYDGASGRARGQRVLDVPAAPWTLSSTTFSANPSLTTKIVAFDPAITEMASMRRPKKLTIRCSDGRDRRYLAKSGEDLRNDERIEHVFDAMRTALASAGTKGGLASGLRTYGVFPLSPRVGLIEWVDGAETVKSVVTRAAGEEVMNAAWAARDATLFGKSLVCHQNHGAYRRWLGRLEVRAEAAKAMDAAFGVLGDLARGRSAPMSRYLLAIAPRAEAFARVRSNFAKSVAASNACTYVVGLGDRHPDNVMVDARNGTLAHIDFGASFGTGTQLAVPELMPMRFTAQFAAPLAPLDGAALVRRHLADALAALRSPTSRPTLDAMLTVFAADPVLDWIAPTAKYDHQQSRGDDNDKDSKNGALPPSVRVDVARGKLAGKHPVDLLLGELQYNVHVKRTGCYEGIRAAVSASLSPSPHKGGAGTAVTPAEQADILIKLASDPALLGVAWFGLAPWW